MINLPTIFTNISIPTPQGQNSSAGLTRRKPGQSLVHCHGSAGQLNLILTDSLPLGRVASIFSSKYIACWFHASDRSKESKTIVFPTWLKPAQVGFVFLTLLEATYCGWTYVPVGNARNLAKCLIFLGLMWGKASSNSFCLTSPTNSRLCQAKRVGTVSLGYLAPQETASAWACPAGAPKWGVRVMQRSHGGMKYDEMNVPCCCAAFHFWKVMYGLYKGRGRT